MKTVVEYMLNIEKINAEIINKMNSIYEKQALIKNIQKEIKTLNYQISELNNEKFCLWGPLGISAGKVFNKLEDSKDEQMRDELKKILDLIDIREEAFEKKVKK